MTTELAPDAQFEELVERVLATTIFNEPFVAQLITEAHNARGRVAEAEAERDTARQIASNAIAEAKKLRAELAEIRQAVTEIEQCSTHDAAGHAETDARARHGSAPLTLAQAAGHLHDWAGDLAGGARTDWPAGHPDVIRGIRAAAEWLDARDRYETETREQHLTALREAGRRLGESFQQLGEAIRDGAAKARAAREAEETPDVDGWTIYPAFDGGGVMVSHDTDADRPTLGALDSIPLAAVLAFIADAAEETPEPGERTE